MNEKGVVQWTPEMGKKFKNALCGRNPEYKDWQEYHKEGDLEGVYQTWKNLAKEEEGSDRYFWRAIIEVIEFKRQN